LDTQKSNTEAEAGSLQTHTAFSNQLCQAGTAESTNYQHPGEERHPPPSTTRDHIGKGIRKKSSETSLTSESDGYASLTDSCF